MNVVQFRNGTYGVRRTRWFRYQFLAHRSALGGDEWRTTDIMIPRSDFEYATREDAEFRMSEARGEPGPDVGEIVPPIDGYQPVRSAR